MKKIFYVTLAAVLLTSCTGVAPFSKQKYGHYKWIHKGAVIEEKTTTVQQGTATEKQHTGAVAVQTETKQVVEENNNVQPAAEVNVTTAPAPVNKQNNTVQHSSTTNHPVSVTETSKVKQTRIKKMVRKISKPGNTNMDDDVRLIIAIILCIILPPMGVYLYRETSSPFALTLILCILSLVGFWFFWYSGLLWLIAMIVALLAVLQDA
jgi:hypothetical protein